MSAPQAGQPFLPYGRHCIDEGDVRAVDEVLRGDFLTTGPWVGRFEQALATAIGAPHVVSCGNGTQALHLAVSALGIGPGDWAVVPSLTFSATANAVRMAGGDVVFADVDPDTGLATAATIEAAAARAGGPVKMVLPVHLAGRACDMQSISELARGKGWSIVDDGCHALGSRVAEGNRVWTVGDGTFSDATAFSFHPVKTIAVGEGGAVSTPHEDIARRMQSLRSHGITRDPAQFVDAELAFDTDGSANPWYYELQEVGFNYRLPDISCALGVSQLGKLHHFLERRRALSAAYDARFADLAPLLRRATAPAGQQPGWHLYTVLIDFAAAGQSRGQVMKRLTAAGIGTQVHYIPVSWLPYYRDRYGHPPMPGERAFYERTLSLPLFPSMLESDVARVSETLSRILRGG